MGKLDQIAMEEKIRKGKEKEMKEKRKQTKEKIKKEKVSFFTDFKNFIMKGNVLDLAVAVVISTAFNAIVTGLVKYIITPFITNLTSGQSVEEWKYVLKKETIEVVDGVETVIPEIAIQYGLWIQTIIDFLIIAFSIFVVVRLIKNIERKMKAKEIAEQEAAAAKKKEEEAAAAAAAAAAVKAEKDALAEFYANVKEQTALLKDISARLDK